MIRKTSLLALACLGIAVLSAASYMSGAPPTAGPQMLALSTTDMTPATSMAFAASIVPATEYRFQVPADALRVGVYSFDSVGSARGIVAGDSLITLSVSRGSGGASAPPVKDRGSTF